MADHQFLRSSFVGWQGIRAGWRLLIWAATFIASVAGLRQIVGWAIDRFHFTFPNGISASEILVQDGVALVAVVIATLLMKRIERRSLTEYGIETQHPFNRFFWMGILWGLVSPTVVIGLMWMLHGYSPGSLALHGSELVKYAAGWGITCVLLGFAEEYVFRGYPLFTLSTGIGFWPAALLLSLGFGALHYFTKPYERWTDFASTGLLALFMCLTLRRTGSLSFAIGFHITFDYVNIFVISGPNAGQYAIGKLLNATFAGPAWLTGGPLGPEASLLLFPVIAAMFLGFDRVYRVAKFPLEPSSRARQPNLRGAVTACFGG
jgi:membrane protease YdiL (CAAX protease family)